MAIFSDIPQSIIGVWGNSFKLYKKAFSKVLPLSVLIGLITNFPAMMLFYRAYKNQFAAYQALPSNSFFIVSVVLLLVIWWFMAVLFLRISDVLEDHVLSCLHEITVATYKYIVYMVAMLFFIILVSSGFIALVIPGIFFLILFRYVWLNILLDDGTVYSSFKNSAKLVWGNWWRTFVVIFVPTIILVGVFQLVTFFLGGFVQPIVIGGKIVLAIIFWSIIMPFMFSLDLCQYRDLKIRAKS